MQGESEKDTEDMCVSNRYLTVTDLLYLLDDDLVSVAALILSPLLINPSGIHTDTEEADTLLPKEETICTFVIKETKTNKALISLSSLVDVFDALLFILKT